VGQVWEALRDCEVAFRPLGAVPLPFKLGGTARLRAGEKIRILGLDHPDKPFNVCFQPLRYSELHADIVPDEIRLKPGYADYDLSVKTAKTIADFSKDAPQTFLNEAFRLVEEVA
jgi:hypothetical protein